MNIFLPQNSHKIFIFSHKYFCLNCLQAFGDVISPYQKRLSFVDCADHITYMGLSQKVYLWLDRYDYFKEAVILILSYNSVVNFTRFAIGSIKIKFCFFICTFVELEVVKRNYIFKSVPSRCLKEKDFNFMFVLNFYFIYMYIRHQVPYLLLFSKKNHLIMFKYRYKFYLCELN